MDTDFVTILCPVCLQTFEVASPPLSELPAELDYDCEVCCRPMMIRFEERDGTVEADVRGAE